MAGIPSLLSPGVYSQEQDLSFTQPGTGPIGAAIIGGFDQGPAFLPMTVNSSNYQQLYGQIDPNFYSTYALQNYLTQTTSATVVRVLGLYGYSSTTYQSLRLTVSGSGGSYCIGFIHPSQLGVTLPTGSITGNPLTFNLTVSGALGTQTYTSMSVNPTSPNYFANVLGTGPVTSNNGWVYTQFPDAINFISGGLAGSGSITLSQTAGDLNLSGSVYGSYSAATTPQIWSQLIGGLRSNLFTISTFSDGNSANDLVKVTIANIQPPIIAGNYGSFSVLVRAINDTDTKLQILEQFDNLNLDPTDPNYIANKIGDYYPQTDASGQTYLDGNYPNNSKYIYVTMASGIDNVSTNALPYGFAPLATPLNRTDIPAPGYVTTRYYTPAGTSGSIANNNLCYGFNFADQTGISYLNPLPSGSLVKTGVGDAGFDLLVSLAGQDETDITPTTATNLRKFTVPLQGGFDGQNPAVIRNVGSNITANNTAGFDLSSATSDGSVAYNMALTTLSNKDAYNINLLVTPGVVYSEHAYVVSQAINMCQDRGDVFYIMDQDVLGATVNAACNDVAGLDTSYAGTYYPWIKILDNNLDINVWVPPSVVMPGVFAQNDQIGAEFFAPAGLQRGGIGSALQVRTRLAQADRDELYSSRVNPISIFPSQGISVWGQKTLQQEDSLLTRINVRRLMIKIKKAFESMGKYVLFSQLSQNTVQQLTGMFSNYLAQIQQQQGLYAFRVSFDTSQIDNNVLIGNIFLQPVPALEYLVLNFNIEDGVLNIND